MGCPPCRHTNAPFLPRVATRTAALLQAAGDTSDTTRAARVLSLRDYHRCPAGRAQRQTLLMAASPRTSRSGDPALRHRPLGHWQAAPSSAANSVPTTSPNLGARSQVPARRGSALARAPGSVPRCAGSVQGPSTGHIGQAAHRHRRRVRRSSTPAARPAEVRPPGAAARTAAHHYSGRADWRAISALRTVVTAVPVLGNGDIWQASDALRMVAETGCDGVVVGRGCLGRPWLFGDLARAFAGRPVAPAPPLGEVVEVLRRHAHLLVEWLTEPVAVRGRSQAVGWYLQGYPGGRSVRRRSTGHPSDGRARRGARPTRRRASRPAGAARCRCPASGQDVVTPITVTLLEAGRLADDPTPWCPRARGGQRG